MPQPYWARCRACSVSRSPTGTTALVGYEVSSESGRDIRRDLARAIVSQNWGLLELRPSRMSLEEIFLSLTTEEKAPEEKAAEKEESPRSQPNE